MASDDSPEQLSRLKTEADRRLRAYLSRSSMPVPTSGTSEGTGEDTSARGGMPDMMDEQEGLPSSVGEGPGVASSRSERRIRGLAKEIKQLLTEDKRRGLPV